MSEENKDKISREFAEQEFDRFAESMDLDFNPVHMDAEDLTAFNKQKERFIRAIINGSLSINENGEAIYMPRNRNSKHDKELTFHERTGATVIAMDSMKKGQDIRKTYAAMAEMCRTHPNTFSGLVGIDIKVCETIFALLMD